MAVKLNLPPHVIDTDPSAPRTHALAVSPSDSVDLANASLIYVGVTGDVAVIPYKDTASQVFKGMPAGGVLPVLVSRVLVSGTTATNLIACF